VERLRNIATAVEQQALKLYLGFKDQPLDKAHEDAALRVAVLSILENARLLDAALEKGSENPTTELAALAQSAGLLPATSTYPSAYSHDLTRLGQMLVLIQTVQLKPSHVSGSLQGP
jgi:hypothetical protein